MAKFRFGGTGRPAKIVTRRGRRTLQVCNSGTFRLVDSGKGSLHVSRAAVVGDGGDENLVHEDIRMLQRFAVTLSLHAPGILAYYDCPISTGPLEGTNTKIQLIKRQAYGFRDHEFFKLKIFALHKTKYALVG